MPTSSASVDDYLASLPPDRREALQAVRQTILDNLDGRVVEVVQYGMIGYAIPHSVYPDGYHCDPKQPLPFASLGSQKNHMAAYLFCLYCDPEAVERFAAEWKATGKRLDMGKSCVRFKKLEDVPLEVLGKAIAEMTVERFIEFYEAQVGRSSGGAQRATKRAARKAPAKKASARKAATKKTAGKQAPAKKKTAKKAPAKKKTAKKAAPKKKLAKKKVAKKKVAAKKTTKRKVAKRTAKKSPARNATKRPTAKKAGKRSKRS